jgi:hypothetical protein
MELIESIMSATRKFLAKVATDLFLRDAIPNYDELTYQNPLSEKLQKFT